MDELRAVCATPLPELRAVAAAMRAALVAGLAADHQPLLCLPTHVRTLPRGDETGTAYAIDLGGSNLRCLRVRLGGAGSPPATDATEVALPPELLAGGSCAQLFAFIAAQMRAFAGAEATGALARAQPRPPLAFSLARR